MDSKIEKNKSGTPRSIFLNANRADIAKIETANKDLVITLKSGRKILLTDGVQLAELDSEFRLVFANNEVLSSQELLLQVQTMGNTSAMVWQEIQPDILNASSQSANAATGMSATQIGLAALGLAALGGGAEVAAVVQVAAQ